MEDMQRMKEVGETFMYKLVQDLTKRIIFVRLLLFICLLIGWFPLLFLFWCVSVSSEKLSIYRHIMFGVSVYRFSVGFECPWIWVGVCLS